MNWRIEINATSGFGHPRNFAQAIFILCRFTLRPRTLTPVLYRLHAKYTIKGLACEWQRIGEAVTTCSEPSWP